MAGRNSISISNHSVAVEKAMKTRKRKLYKQLSEGRSTDLASHVRVNAIETKRSSSSLHHAKAADLQFHLSCISALYSSEKEH